MSTTVAFAPRPAAPGESPDGDAAPVTRRAPGDRPVLAVLALAFAAIAAVSWRRWGVPEIDAGAELTTADLVKHGAVLYRDVRYYYGPLGLYSLALAFKLLGTSFTTAYIFGLAQAAAIIGVFYALARQWLAPVTAGLTSAIVLAIGFSGTAFNFVLPHTNSATFGLLMLLAALLALARERLLVAGIAAGLVALTRPEFLAVAAGALTAFVIARWRIEGRARALATAWRLALAAIAIPGVILGLFAARVGLHVLIGENLWPAKFISVGAKTEHSWMPFTLESALGLLARAAIYLGLLGGLVIGAERWRGRAGASRLRALWPLVLVLVSIGALDGLLRAGGVMNAQRSAIEHEARHLMLGMSWLPALALAAAALALVRLWRRQGTPLGRSWPADLALVVAAAGLGLRAYNEFTTYGSYAAYYAAPPVLLLGIFHARLAARRPQAAAAIIGVLGLLAAGLAVYAVGGLYRHENTAVHTPRGTFLTSAASAPALQAAVDEIDRLSRPGQQILAAPLEGGLYFMTGRRPALRELTVLPALISSPAEERAAIARLAREHVSLAVIGARSFTEWGTPSFGVDYDARLGSYLRANSLEPIVLGSLSSPAAGTNPSQGFTVLRLAR